MTETNPEPRPVGIVIRAKANGRFATIEATASNVVHVVPLGREQKQGASRGHQTPAAV